MYTRRISCLQNLLYEEWQGSTAGRFAQPFTEQRNAERA